MPSLISRIFQGEKLDCGSTANGSMRFFLGTFNRIQTSNGLRNNFISVVCPRFSNRSILGRILYCGLADRTAKFSVKIWPRQTADIGLLSIPRKLSQHDDSGRRSNRSLSSYRNFFKLLQNRPNTNPHRLFHFQ